ncbi:YdbL family protein [Chlorobium sp. KB01]|uniref:YdbL family protein n=1 Tax=Chlorobium sp. KB01 TaxID=1917528 RepID=UPI000975E414|nr:YdbL family protein [Chlorobium sp. KB01]
MRTIQRIASKTAILLMLVLSIALPAYALDLETARSSGLAGEVDNGLLAVPPGASADAQELITTINNSRRAEYAKVAAQNNLSLDVVGAMMYQKIYSRLPAGTWIQVQGNWVKK